MVSLVRRVFEELPQTVMRGGHENEDKRSALPTLRRQRRSASRRSLDFLNQVPAFRKYYQFGVESPGDDQSTACIKFHPHSSLLKSGTGPASRNMSTELPFWEGQMDALVNTLWWTFDEKFGRMAHRSPSRGDSLFAVLKWHAERLSLSVPWRIALAFSLPYVLGVAIPVADKWGQAWKCVALVLVWPWIWRSFVYVRFLDPLRHLPGPKVLLYRALLTSGTLVIRLGSRGAK